MLTAIFLFLLIYFVIIPLVKVAITIHRARRKARSIFDNFTGRTNRTDEPPQPPKPTHRKKIDPEMGEFVKFEDLPADSVEFEYHEETTVVVEEQVVDAEWEDIK